MMDIVVYDKGFNANEWYVIITFTVLTALIWSLPRMLSPLETIFALLFGVTAGLVADHTVAVPPLDLYDVGDESSFTLFDFFSYLMYLPFGYWFLYWYVRMRIGGIGKVLYIACWTLFGISFEWLGVQFGVFHYKHGYEIAYSLPIYLIVQSLLLNLYKIGFSRDRLSE